MNKTIVVLLLILTVACSKSKQKNNGSRETTDNSLICEHSVPFGDIEICLPEMDGMIETYADPKVKAKVDRGNFEGNSILAYYIKNETFEQFEELIETGFDDYFQLFATDILKGVKAEQKELNQLEKMADETYIKEDWDGTRREVEKKFDFLSMEKPIPVEKYSLDKRVRTYILLSKFHLDNGKEIVMLMTMNLMLIKERIICLSYYKYYEGDETIKAAKLKNDEFVLELLDKNK